MRWYSQKTFAEQSVIADEKTGRTVAVAYEAHDGPLIAAAPQLLEACKCILEQHDAGVDLSVRDRHEWCRVAAAIAAATETE